MINRHRIQNVLLYSLVITILLFLYTCKSAEDNERKVEVGKGFLTVLPLDVDDFFLFVNLGHMSQPGHIFPSDHGGFYLTDYMTPVPIFSPADMIIKRIVESEHVNHGYTDYGLTLSVNDDEFQIVIGHMSNIHDSILEQAETFSETECETYSTSGDTYRNCLTWTEIPISAGDTLGMAGGNPGQFGLDFGTFDKTRKIEFATDRFDNYLYPYTVSPLDYFTDEINQILIPQCGDSFCRGEPTVRTKPPVGGTVDYDVPGSAQGIWFKVGEPMFPEDPHIALVYHNVDPDVPIFSIGNSLIGLNSGPYTFATQDTGYVDRSFDSVKPDGHIYQYDTWYHCSTTPDMRAVFLLQLIDASHLKIEKQDDSLGPPWQFTNNAVMFDR
jgi:hypothetical protein